MSPAQRESRLKSVLPVSASQLEVDLIQTFSDVLEHYLLQTFGDAESIPVRHLWNPELCPPELLRYLAVALSVDTELSEFTITQQRNLIRDAFTTHLQKGTVGSIKRIIESLGWELAPNGLVEGRRDPLNNSIVVRTGGGWAQFTVTIMNTVPVRQAQVAARLIQSTAPASRRLVTINFAVAPLYYNGGLNNEGEYTLFSDGTYTHGAVTTHHIDL